MMRFLKATLLGLGAVLLSAALAFAVECPGCGKKNAEGAALCPGCGTKLPVTKKPEPKKPEPKKPEPKKPEPKKPEPKRPEPKGPSAREVARAKAAAAKKAYVAADRAYRANSKDYTAGIKALEAADKRTAGTSYAAKAEGMVLRLKKLKGAADAAAKAKAARAAAAAKAEAARAAAAKKLADGKKAYDAAYAAYRANSKDYAAALKGFGEAKKTAAGTAYEAKADRMIARIEKAKARAVAKKPEPKKPEPKKPEPKKPEPKKPAPKKVAKKAYGDALAAWKADRANYDAAINKFEKVKKDAAGTGYDVKAGKMITKLKTSWLPPRGPTTAPTRPTRPSPGTTSRRSRASARPRRRRRARRMRPGPTG